VLPVTPTAQPETTTGKQGQTQTTDANVLFTEGDSVAPIDLTSITLLDESGQPATEVPAKDVNGNVIGNYVLNPDGTITFTPNPDFVGTPVPVRIQAKDANGTAVTTTYTPTVLPVTPTAQPETTTGKQGQTQTTDANVLFTEGDSVAPIDLTSITLLDESGQPATEVPAKDSNGSVIGSYVLNPDGTITFTPNPDFVGTPVPVRIQAK
ncbi:cell surface-associated protein, partial [Streptococcus suis]|nr:cell surface-associated protein [Streptococcus suis]